MATSVQLISLEYTAAGCDPKTGKRTSKSGTSSSTNSFDAADAVSAWMRRCVASGRVESPASGSKPTQRLAPSWMRLTYVSAHWRLTGIKIALPRVAELEAQFAALQANGATLDIIDAWICDGIAVLPTASGTGRPEVALLS